jgi:hypothetical protein
LLYTERKERNGISTIKEKGEPIEMKPYIGFATVWHKEDDPYDVSSYEYYIVAENDERARDMIADRIKMYRHAKFVIKVEEVPIDEGEQLRDVVSASYKGVIMEQALKEAMAFESEKEEAIREESAGCVSTDFKHLLSHPEMFYSFIKTKLKKDSKVIISDGQLRVYTFGGLTIDEQRKENKKRSDLERKKRSLEREIKRTERELKVYL